MNGFENMWENYLQTQIYRCKDYLSMQTHPNMRKDYLQEESMMKATYNGLTGEVVLLKRNEGAENYQLSIFDHEKGVTYAFDCVYLKDVKFFGGAVSFGA